MNTALQSPCPVADPTPPFTFAWKSRSRSLEYAKALQPDTKVTGTGSYSVFNLTGGYDLGIVKLRAGIDNVLNRRLPIVGANWAAGDSNSNQTNLNFYDGLGRRFFVGMKATF